MGHRAAIPIAKRNSSVLLVSEDIVVARTGATSRYQDVGRLSEAAVLAYTLSFTFRNSRYHSNFGHLYPVRSL